MIYFKFCIYACDYCGYVHLSSGAGRGLKRASDPLKLELQMLVNHILGTKFGSSRRTIENTEFS